MDPLVGDCGTAASQPTAVLLGATPEEARELQEQFPQWSWRIAFSPGADPVDLVVVADGSLDEAILIAAFRHGHRRTRVVPPEALADVAGGQDWWRGRSGLAKLRAATKRSRNLRVAKYVALALQPAFRWPSVDALDVLHAVRIAGPANHESELRRLGYRWNDPEERRHKALLQTVEESELEYVADLLAFVINTGQARAARPVRTEVLDVYRTDYAWLERESDDIPFRWPTI